VDEEDHEENKKGLRGTGALFAFWKSNPGGYLLSHTVASAAFWRQKI
jgi:hypothetical protein